MFQLSKYIMVVVVVICLLGVGCGQKMGFAGAPVAQNNQTDPTSITSPIDLADGIPQCEVNIPQMELDGNVNGFEIAGGFNVVFGYNTSGSHGAVGGSANIDVSWAQMDLSVVGKDPMTSIGLASTRVDSNQTKTSINTSVNFGPLAANPNFYFQSPLASVSAKALSQGVSGIKSQMDQKAWVGRVLKHIDDSHVLISGGDLAGVQVGDQFNLHNVTHFWSGSPCGSTYFGSSYDSQTPEEIIQIEASPVNQNVSIGKIVKFSDRHARMGAEVTVAKLGPATNGSARYLKKEITLGLITAQPIALPGGGSFDLQSAMNGQIVTALIDSKGFIFKVK